MRGQLTEQLPEDGTAEELYQYLQSKKQALVRNGKLKKEKPLSAISDEEKPFDLPTNWRWVRLKDLCTKIVDGDHNPPAGVQEITNYLMLSAQNINKGKLSNLNNVRYLSATVFEEENKRTQLEVGDVLLTIVGTIGRTCVYQGGYNICFQRSVAVISTLIDSKYLKYALDIPFVQNYMEANATGAAQVGFYLNKLEKLLIPLPPLTEQKRIVERIEQVFSALDTLDALQAQYSDNLTVLKSKLIDDAIQGKLTEQLPEDGTAEELYQQVQTEKALIIKERQGHLDKSIKAVGQDVPYLLPTHWKWIRFGDIGLFKKGPFGSALTKSMFVPKSANAIKVYEQQHAIKKNPTLGTYYISEDYFRDKMKGFEVKSGDVLISCAGTIGETYVLPAGIEPGIINQALMRVTLASGINKKFFQYYFDSRLKSSAKAGNGSAIVNIPPFDVIKNWYFPLPPLAEQKRIVDRLTELLAVCDKFK